MTEERTLLLNLIRASVVGETGFAIPESLDWSVFIDEVQRQGVAVIASDGLQRMYDAGLYSAAGDPRELRRAKAKWLAKTMQFEQRYAGQVAAAKKMASWLAEEGIRTMVLKGVVVSDCYPVPSHRYSADFDCFLIKDGEHLEAYELGNRVMEKRGLTVDRSFYKNSSFQVDGLHVENHKFCTPLRGNNSLKRLEETLQRMAQEGPLTEWNDSGLMLPPVLFSALFLTEHAYSHFLHEGLNLRHILDWALFKRKHESDLDWTAFGKYIDEFGFRRFYEAFAHLGDYVLGLCEYSSLTAPERRMMDSVWAGLDLHESVRGFAGKLRLVGNTLRAGWKYREFAPISMAKALAIQVKGFFFDRNPTL